MLVYTSAYATAEEAALRPMLLPRILYDNYLRGLTASSVTASTESTDGPKDAPLRPETHEFWRPNALNATFEVALGASKSVSAIGIAGHTFGSKASTVTLETKLGGGGYSIFADDVSPADDSALLFLDTPRSADTVRVSVAGTGLPTMAVLFVGPTLTMEKPLQPGYKPPYLNKVSVRQSNVSRGGHYLGQDFWRKGTEGSVSFRGLTESFVRNTMRPFANATRNYPYFFAGRPDSDLNDVTYAWHERDFDLSYHDNFRFTVSWSLMGQSHE